MIIDLQEKVLSNQIKIAYQDEGDKKKPILLFIHGLANYHGVWHWNIELLKNNFRCIAIDLPGNGHSSRGFKQYSIDFYAECVMLFIQEMKLKNVSLVGHSMGGMIAIKIVLAEKIKIEKLILFAPAGFEYYSPHESMLFRSAISFGNFLNLDEVQIDQSVRTSFYKQNAITEKIIKDLKNIIQHNDRTQYRKMLEQNINSMLDDDIFHQLKKIQIPTLVFFGENDMLIPNRFLHPQSTKEIAKKACKEISDVQLFTYPNTGHFVQIEKAKEVCEEIEIFLESF